MDSALICLGVLCLGYGLALGRANRRVRSRSRFHAAWLVLGLAAFGAAAALHGSAPLSAIHTAAFAAGVIVLAIAFSAAVLGCRIMAHAHGTPPDGLAWIIVLGAQVRPDGLPTKALRYRLEAAGAYLLRNPFTRVVVSGGRGADEPETEAAAMARWLMEQGVDGERIVQEGASTTTAENIAFARRIIAAQDGSLHMDAAGDASDAIGIVTNDFHLYRALRIARRQGLADVRGIPAYSTPFYLPNNLLRECCAIIKNKHAGTM